METRTVEQVEGWNSRPLSDGYAGLRELSDGEFSGAVRAGGAWLFMLNGRTIGVHEGSLEDFDGTDGTAYAAPHPSLPLLFSMKETGGKTRAKYYTNDTPLSEADSTLTDGGFTGYVELSENVLSGDYYVAYYGGRSMSVAFVGASEQVISGDEAFERAADEVGIYEVKDVEVEVIDLPEPEGKDADSDPSASGGAGTGTARGADAETPAADASPEPTAPETSPGETNSTESAGAEPGNAAGAATGGSPAAATDSREAPAERPSRSPPEESAGSEPTATEAGASGAAGVAEAEPDPEPSPSEAATTDAQPTRSPSATAESAPDPTTESSAGPTAAEASGADAEAEGEPATDDEAAFREEEAWRETTTIPSLDPDRTDDADDAAGAASAAGGAGTGTADRERARSSSPGATADSRSQSPSSGESAAGRSRPDDRSAAGGRAAEPSESATAATGAGAGAADESDQQAEQLRSQLRQRGRQVEQLEERLSSVRSERDELERERDALRQEVERLEAKLESADSDGTGASTRLGRAEAFDGTNLFVRYRSKGDATLEEAADGDADPDDVNDNLRLEHHTQFEAADAAVDGAPFEEFLADSFEYRFASWVVSELLYEIRDTGHRGGLRGLYDAIPKIDRVDLHGSVSAGTDGDDTRQESFDVIMRDRMGNPLIVADLNDSRDPTTGEMMGSLVDAATGVAEAHDELTGAFQVTESFFEPEALETTEAATSGGLLSREKRESFVKLSRKRGYHLCLVESRSGGFHLNVPEL